MPSKDYHLVVVNTRSKTYEVLTARPVTLSEAYTMRSKFGPLGKGAWIRIHQVGSPPPRGYTNRTPHHVMPQGVFGETRSDIDERHSLRLTPTTRMALTEAAHSGSVRVGHIYKFSTLRSLVSAGLLRHVYGSTFEITPEGRERFDALL